MKKSLIFLLGFAILGSAIFLLNANRITPVDNFQDTTQIAATEQNSQTTQVSQQTTSSPVTSLQQIASTLQADPAHNPAQQKTTALLAEPIQDAKARVTKKFFGTKVSPGHSPVSPEKFTGYHTGVDFETFPSEQNTEVPIFAACDGPLVMKKIATGYGGVAVQQCSLDGQAVTIIYGHLKYTSITATVGQALKPGQQFAILGKGYSTETDGERKHLHFGIHKGTTVNILGYVNKPALLSNWLDALKYLQ